ncbi:secretin and TonB N-terminal domain-containing protein [Pseudomonas mosselii]|uniref:secretin N-terminal domain-containing protein n=1 Tax=Pseudomonas mosselii TaxID=78327 RepID=UPI000A101D36|nr:secretin N-terminal domain-containing protein [Pseudomonas mosselii]MDH1659607.1 secretin and TonB N-terminal domain-containing protein [Pseudomonas mosselii]MDH1718047.1 secretin and TonB N-terminal domain-containing protein [Pseudomonas mosselii]MDH1722974.1 secretin and TonB N-terminal domain-containing protein [Pseudomonas mosselii]MDN4499288.1 secretin N-terminal domain-containing protein [Pseudomonas mosselii]MEA3237698.1 secretin and TonB N-terminal domain-containing protein [Pseudom
MKSSKLCKPAPFMLLALCVAIGGCGSSAARKDSQELIKEGQYEAGIARLEEALREDPRDTELNIALAHGRQAAVEALLTQADSDRARHDFAGARMGYGRVLTIETNNRRAQEGIRQLELIRTLDDRVALGQAALRQGDLFGAERYMREVLRLDPQNQKGQTLRSDIENVQARTATPYPQLRSKLERPVTLEFRDADLKTIFEVLAQVAGINFIFDKDLRPDMKATIFVREVRIEDAVALLLEQNQLRQKIVNDNTLLVYPDSPQKTKDYQELVMRTFYLTSIDANTALNMVKTMLKTRDVFVDERLNTLTMRDTPDAVRMAEKLLQSQDQSNPEVVLEVEVMEVATSRILDLGLQWPNTFGVLTSDGKSVSVLDQLRGIDSSRISISPAPQAKINAQDKDINTLASPVIRVSNREQARIHIGQRVPIISATSVPSTQGPVITESVTYLDVGLKLEVQPTVHLNNEVAIKVALEVSNATPLEATRQGTIPVQVDTRNAQTSLRLHDGETQVLAGLVRNDHNASGNKIPGLGDIPGLGRLFGSNKDDMSKSELVLAITPRIVRNLPYQSPSDMEFATGTESALQVRQLAQPVPASAVPTEAPDDESQGAPRVEGQMAVVPASPRPRP